MATERRRLLAGAALVLALAGCQDKPTSATSAVASSPAGGAASTGGNEASAADAHPAVHGLPGARAGVSADLESACANLLTTDAVRSLGGYADLQLDGGPSGRVGDGTWKCLWDRPETVPWTAADYENIDVVTSTKTLAEWLSGLDPADRAVDQPVPEFGQGAYIYNASGGADLSRGTDYVTCQHAGTKIDVGVGGGDAIDIVARVRAIAARLCLS
jgi:hypothetical protein